MANHSNEVQRRHTKQNRQRKGKISCISVVKSVKAEWDGVKRSKGFTSNNEMVKHMLRGLRRANVIAPKCSEANSVLCVDSAVKTDWDAVKRAYGYKSNTDMIKDLLRKDKKRGNDVSLRLVVGGSIHVSHLPIVMRIMTAMATRNVQSHVGVSRMCVRVVWC